MTQPGPPDNTTLEQSASANATSVPGARLPAAAEQLPAAAEQWITRFLDVLRSAGGFNLEYAIAAAPAHLDPTAAAPVLEVILSGPDTPLLLDRNGELLHAIESVAAAILRLAPEQSEQLRFDAAGFKADRAAAIAQVAADGIERVRATNRPFPFPPMNSRERRLLHLALVPSGLATASSGLGPRRFVVLYPAGQTPDPELFDPPARSDSPVRRGPISYRNQKGSGQPSRPPRGPRPTQPPSLNPPPAAALSREDDARNRQDPNRPSPETPAATEARLDSIRRAFRKR